MRDYEATAEFLGGVEIAHVTDVQQIEASVGESDAVAGGAPGFHLAPQLRRDRESWIWFDVLNGVWWPAARYRWRAAIPAA